jgi:hypothetical protein
MTETTDTTERTVRARQSDTEYAARVVSGAVDAAVPLEDPEVGTLRVPGSATEEEADAIAAAVHAHLAATGRLPESDGDREARQWVTANRLRGIGADLASVSDEKPADPWAAASRASGEW